MNSIDVIKSILTLNPGIEALSFHEYAQSKLIQDDISNWRIEEETMFEYALSLKKNNGTPFWNGIMLSAFDNPDYSKKVLRAALRHNPINNLHYLSREEISSSLNSSYALCSKVKIKNSKEEYHLPLIDFHIPPSRLNQQVVDDVCQNLDVGPGWILNSGESYHFIGSRLMTWGDLYCILSKAIVYNPIVDAIWISHQLRESCCSLRIGEKKGVVPTVVLQIIGGRIC